MKKIITTGGGTVAYQVSGPPGKLPLVLLHGFCEDSRLWNDFIPLLGDIPSVVIDLPGFGNSDIPTRSGLDYLADAVIAVLNEIETAQCILVGHSMGGYTALTFAAKYPQRLAGLGLFHAHPYPDTAERMEGRRRGIDMLRAGKKDLYVAQLFPNLFAPDFAIRHPEIVESMIAQGRHQHTEGIIAALESMMARPDHMETLEQATCPVLFILGALDGLIPAQEGLRAALAPAISSVHLLEAVGHMGMLEAPDRTADILSDFYRLACAV
jgi:pimeloyl-ACP methyl ester carboxylesterase